MNALLQRLGRRLARYLSQPRHVHSVAGATPLDLLRDCLQPADVLLVEGNSRISTAIKYLTQSTWSHAVLFVGGPEEHCFVEADTVDGVRSVGLQAFKGLHTRICRAHGLSDVERRAVTEFAVERIGYQYDLRNLFDLARYLLPTPPVPSHVRRDMIALGSGDPTRAICSTLIAEAFQSIRYPILPFHRVVEDCGGCHEELLRVRHHSLFAPRDFDVSPYFSVIKPSLSREFDFHQLRWENNSQTDFP